MNNKPTREYSNGEIVVEWRSDLCVHCKRCIEGLPQVFNLDARPWVNIAAASTKDIRNQVNDCPSGALRWRKSK